MADSYYMFSEMIKHLTPEACKWVKAVLQNPDSPSDIQALANALNRNGDDEFIEEMALWPRFEWRFVNSPSSTGLNSALHLYSEDTFDSLHVGWFVQALICRFMPNYIFAMTYSASCSKPRVGEFGGGWLVVTKGAIVEGSTWSAAESAIEALQAGLEP